MRPGWRAVPVDYDPSGDTPESDDVADAWIIAAEAYHNAVPQGLNGLMEWQDRMRAAMRVLADRLPPMYVYRAPVAGDAPIGKP